MWGSPFFPGIFTSASRSCLMLLNPKKSHFFTCHPHFKSHFLLPPLTSPAHTNLSSSCVYSSRAALTARSAPMVGCRFHMHRAARRKQRRKRDAWHGSEYSCLLGFLGSSFSPVRGPSLPGCSLLNALKRSPSVFTQLETLRGEACQGN